MMTSFSGMTAFELREADWLEVRDARARILAAAHTLESELISVADARGRALAEEVVATATLPPWNNSAMDGYAVRASDVRGSTPSSPITLSVIGVVHAGASRGPRLGPDQAVRIMTGAPIPPGADTVIRVEDTDAEARSGHVEIYGERDCGRHVRPAGQDMLDGESLLSPGFTITSGSVGVLAAAGQDTVLVHRAPTVALLATGNELRPSTRYADVQAGHGIPESNVPMLSALVREVGGYPIDLGIADDDPADILKRVSAGAGADVLVTIGGASMGEADLTKRVLDQEGFEQNFWRVKMRPGSPVSFGWITHGSRRQPVFGLPGNPSSAFVTYEVFVRPFLLKLAGHRRILRRTIRCLAAGPFSTPAALTHFQRVSLAMGTEGMWASLSGAQGSGLVTGLARADGLAVIPPEVQELNERDPVDVMLLDTGPAALEVDME